ncbi:MAG: NUDIX domain-containing protein [candidate division SR1 bacterium]|nr:NUDIX domain-containing protein [candidate division SR1 bacterium]
MTTLKIFELPESGEHTTTKKTYRTACRGIVLDKDNLMPLLFVGNDNYHKLPGGGMEDNEDKIMAFKREVIEETGCEIEDIEEIGNVIEKDSTWEQTSYCYIGKIIKKGNHKFTPGEKNKGYVIKWVSIPEALSLIEKDSPRTLGSVGRQQRDLYILQEIKKKLSTRKK